MKSHALKTTAIAGILIGAGLTAGAIRPPEGPLHRAPVQTAACVDYQLITNGHAHSGQAEFPTTAFEFQHGMKHRYDLAPDAAMIFNMGGNRDVAFWMKDTPSALDLAFFGTQGELIFLTTAEPLSEDLISAPGLPPIRHVMELPAGRAAEIELEVGATHLVVAAPTACVDPVQSKSRKDT